MAGALDGLLVIEHCQAVAASFTGRLLASLGADVVKLEHPGIDRHIPPLLSATLHCGKRGVTIDLQQPTGIELLRRLLAKADIFIGDDADLLEHLGAPDAADNPRLVYALVTPFGTSGPGSSRRLSDGNVAHASGQSWLLRDGHDGSGGVPLNPGGRAAVYDSGVVATIAILAAIYERATSGIGQVIDVSMQEAAMAMERVTLGRVATEMALGLPPDPTVFQTPLYRCRDGHIVILPAEDTQWRALVDLMGSPLWAGDDRFATSVGRASNADEVNAHIGAWAAAFTKEDLYHRCQRHGVPAGAVRDAADVVHDEQLSSRGFFATVEDPVLGPLVVPTGATAAGKNASIPPAPTPGQHNEEVLGGLLKLAADGRANPAGHGGRMNGALDGVRIVEFGLAWAGPLGTMLLSSFGAEVIKVESRTHPDFSRRVYGNADLDMAPNFQDVNMNKQSVLLDLKTPRGRQLALDLIARSDAVLTNMRPGVVDRLGLGYEDARHVRPDIVYLAASANGTTGEAASYGGWAPTFAALSGMAHVTGLPGHPPVPMSMPSDIRCGYAVALALLAGLIHRRRTGAGQYIDVSFVEALSSLIPDVFASYAQDGHSPGPLGNRDQWYAPQGCYRSGDGHWLSVAVTDDHEWQAMCTTIGRDDLAASGRLADHVGRLVHHDQIDEAISAWVQERPAAEAAAALQAVGVAAVRVETPESLATDDHLHHRGAYTTVEHPRIGHRVVLTMPWKLSRTPPQIRAPGPLLGQHTDDVLRQLLGLSDDEINALEDERVIR